MPKRVLPLTDAEIKSARPGPKSHKMSDGRGLYLEVDPSGSKWWRLKCRFGKEKRLSLGMYPDVTLEQTRQKRNVHRDDIANGIDPAVKRKVAKSARADLDANSFEVVAREWPTKFIDPMAESHKTKVYARFTNDIFPQIGARPIAEVTAPELLAAVRLIENRGAGDTAHRTLGSCGQVFAYAIATGRGTRNIAHDLRGSLEPVTEENFAAVTKPEDFVGILRTIDGYKGTYQVQRALRLAPLVFVRPGELGKAKSEDFELDAEEWTLKLSKRESKKKSAPKRDKYLIKPLSKQAMVILRELYAFSGGGIYVFPGCRKEKGRPLSDNTVLGALRRLGIPKEEMCGHGFRATARTMIVEQLKIRQDLIEHELDHDVIDPNGRAYNRATFLPERRLMMQTWADYLDKLKAGEIVPAVRAKRLTCGAL